MQKRPLSETRQTRPAHNGVASGRYCRASGKAHRRTGGKMNLVSSPALRPSPPHGCRKRSFGQGHALSGRFAGLDRMTLLSGYGCLRATDRGSLQRGLGQRKSAVQKHKGNNTKKRFSPPAVFPHTDMRRIRYMQICPGVRSAEFYRYMWRCLPPGLQMSAPSCVLCRSCLASDTAYTACA